MADSSALDTASRSIPLGEQPNILANLALANAIFSASLAQQNMLINQQVMFQIELAALAKSLEVLLAAELRDPDALAQLTSRITELFEQLHTKAEQRLLASQKQISELIAEVHAQAMPDKAEQR